MKIDKISCTQFAGIRDRDISLGDGLNVIYGKNESGKSTLVNLMSRVLFQNAKIDGRKDKDFISTYFPSKMKGDAVRGDFADGKLTFTTDSGTFVLSKEWGNDPRCALSTPQGVIRDAKKIADVLKNELNYGEGVYTEMLFSSQIASDAALQTILDASKKSDTKQEIIDVVSKAFSESDGITADAIGEKIDEIISSIEGQHWDVSKNAPVRKVGDRWKAGLGEILKAYYAWDDAKKELDEIARLEQDADDTTSTFEKRETELRDAESAYNSFNSCIDALRQKKTAQTLLENYETNLKKMNGVLSDWPVVNENISSARALCKESNARALLDRYEKAKGLHDEMNALYEVLSKCPRPDEKEIQNAKNARRNTEKLENKLCGMNITAAINMLGDYSAHVTLLRTGEELDISSGNTAITEAVNITIAGVMEMQLAPADIDVDEIEASISQQKAITQAILDKYNTNTIEELEALAEKADKAKTDYERAHDHFDLLMGTQTYEELEEKVGEINGDIRTKEVIDSSILALCGTSDVTRFITVSETTVKGYEKEYMSISKLKENAEALEAEIGKIKNSLEPAQNIPEEYAHISDPDAHLKKLKTEMNMRRTQRDDALREKTASLSKLEVFKEQLISNPVENEERTRLIFEEKSSLLRHWYNIKKVFEAQRADIDNNPLQDIGESFAKYLGIISAGKIDSEFTESKKLNMNIYSSDRLIDYSKLSEGTKETVSLAFRLAVLDHLFPDGGGVIVLDDPLANMDSERAAQSCELIKKCAERHQAIFLTCRDEYRSLTDGNIITLD